MTARSMQSSERAPRSIAVLGLGNTLLGDDAFGPDVIHALLDAWELPIEVEALDLGTPGLDLAPYLLDREAVLVIDAIDGDAPPGTLMELGREALLHAPTSARVSPHDPGLPEALQLIELQRERPIDAGLIGVVPSQTEIGEPLSAPVLRAVPEATRAIVAWLVRRGLTPSLRAPTRASTSTWNENNS